MRYIDPDLNYCPQCDEEYREDFNTCASCHISLITGTERLALEEAEKNKLAARSMDISPDDELTNIKKGTLNEMKQLQAVLGAASIPSLLAGEESNCGTSCGGNMYLQIKNSDGNDAMEVLAEEFEKTTSLSSHDLSNAHAVFDTGVSKSKCPACGCRFSTSSSTCPDCGLCF
ncbi:hypothetical protein JYT85_00275 [Desulfocapsa sp. AH-315-G09]|uniref:Zinc ribbon domain-containing protein n=1 Tax=Desulfotalea psychrophila TaxID=84980 RepID=A0ABS3ATP0_9BACT|nr:hypothetical protein [Desulfocapsa sp.]MBN4065066.1 hypothetical protein [Desulfocapsa sp. AH-315-G09]MBN4067977.1 hypothetical protein [Desulfotalea psychrophila]